MSNKKLIGADYLLLLLYLNDKKPIKGSIRLVKMMFLFEMEVVELLKKNGLDTENIQYGFYPYNFGPFSKDLYEQIELFKNIKFIRETNINEQEDMGEINFEETPFIDEIWQEEDYASDNKYMQYKLDYKGIEFVDQELINKLNNGQKKLLENFKTQITSTPIKQILYYVYSKYPQFTKNSLIKNEVLGSE